MAAKTAVAVKKQPRELTEEEILKAPEKDYMNDAQLAFFKKRLEEIRDQILRNADDTGEQSLTVDPHIWPYSQIQIAAVHTHIIGADDRRGI